MANIKDFAVGLVLTAPSPATSGTSLTLRAGEGATMPTPPFYVTASPPSQMTTLGTSEKLLVTAISSDTLTIVRAQGATTAKSIAADWIIANALYADDVMTSGVTLGGSFTGTVNGSNATFTLPVAATAITVYKNGVRMRSGTGNDYVFTNNNTVTFESGAIPATGSVLTYDAIIGSTASIAGSNSWVSQETPTGTINGTNKVFTLSRPYVGGTLKVYVNGLRQALTTHFTETSSTTFTLDDAPLTGDILRVEYQFVLSTSGNADTVDGIHANTSPSANALMPLGSDSKYSVKVLPGTVLASSTRDTPLTWTSGDLQILTITITVTQEMVDSGRKLKIVFFAPQVYSLDNATRARFTIYEGAALMARIYKATSVGGVLAHELNMSTPAIAMPSVGSHTYTVNFIRDVGSSTPTVYAETGSFMYLEAEIK